MNTRELLYVLIEISPEGDDRPAKALEGWSAPAVGNHVSDPAALALRDTILDEFTQDYLSRAHTCWLPAGWKIVQAADRAHALMTEVLATPMFEPLGSSAERPRVRHAVRQAMRAALVWHYSVDQGTNGVEARLLVERALERLAISPHATLG